MPKIFEYLGFIFFFYSNDHEPIHCHVQKGEIEVKVELFFTDDKLTSVSIRKNNGAKQNLTAEERKRIKKFVEKFYKEIVEKWYTFRAGKRVSCTTINKEIK